MRIIIDNYFACLIGSIVNIGGIKADYNGFNIIPGKTLVIFMLCVCFISAIRVLRELLFLRLRVLVDERISKVILDPLKRLLLSRPAT